DAALGLEQPLAPDLLGGGGVAGEGGLGHGFGLDGKGPAIIPKHPHPRHRGQSKGSDPWVRPFTLTPGVDRVGEGLYLAGAVCAARHALWDGPADTPLKIINR